LLVDRVKCMATQVVSEQGMVRLLLSVFHTCKGCLRFLPKLLPAWFSGIHVSGFFACENLKNHQLQFSRPRSKKD
jgi:hypothetical protein